MTGSSFLASVGFLSGTSFFFFGARSLDLTAAMTCFSFRSPRSFSSSLRVFSFALTTLVKV